MNIAERIQKLRKEKGISQEELADKIGVSRQAVSKWENAQSIPDIEKTILLSEYFEVTADYILKGEEVEVLDITESLKSLYISGAVVCGALAGIWAFSANRFRNIEIILITLAGAAIGLGIGVFIKNTSKKFKI